MSLFPCSSSIFCHILVQTGLNHWNICFPVFNLWNCNMWNLLNLPMIVFFRKNICFELLITGILRYWFILDLTKTMVFAVSNTSGSSNSFVSKNIGILLLILPKLILNWMLIRFPAGTIVVLGILCTKDLPWSADWLTRLASALILFDLMFFTLVWSESIRAFSLLVLSTNTFMTLNPKIGLSNGYLITKKGTSSSSTVLLHSSNNSIFISLHPRNNISVWLFRWSHSLSHGSNNFPTSKVLAHGKLLSSHLCDSRNTWPPASIKNCVATLFILHATWNFLPVK